MAKWKAPGPDKVHTFWIKNFAELHGRIVEQLQQYLDRGNVPDWMVLGKTVLTMKEETKAAEVVNYRHMLRLYLYDIPAAHGYQSRQHTCALDQKDLLLVG